MSSIRKTVIVLVAWLTAAASHGSQIRCPDTVDVKGKKAPLDAGSVFEGKPAQLTDLMPDLQTYEWDITPNQRYVTARGDAMYLVCRYKGVKKTLDLKIPADATFCKVEQTDRGTAAWCKTPERADSDNNVKDGHGHQP